MDYSTTFSTSYLSDRNSTVRPRLGRRNVLSSHPQPISSFSTTTALSGRKRPRVETHEFINSTPLVRTATATSSSTASHDLTSPSPLVDDRYRLAGGSSTPACSQIRREEEEIYDFEQDCRPRRHNNHHSSPSDYFPYTPSNQTTDNRLQLSPIAAGVGISRSILAFTGNVVGKVINFCWNTAFHGFFAGPGEGYSMEVGTPYVRANSLADVYDEGDVFSNDYRRQNTTARPGRFPEDDFVDEYASRIQSRETSVTPTQYNDSTDGFARRNSWVLVNSAQSPRHRPSLPSRRSRPSTASLYARPLARVSSGGRPKLQTSKTTSSNASFASPRAFDGSDQIHTPPDSPEKFGRQAKRPKSSSMASPRMNDLNGTYVLPKSPEVTKFEKRLRRNDFKHDESVKRLSQQMQDMIQEARQALGLKYEISDEVDDEGYADFVSSDGHEW